MRGTILTARTGDIKLGRGIISKFVPFYYPHKNSFPEDVKYIDKVSNPQITNIINKYATRSEAISDLDLIRQYPLDSKVDDMSPKPLGGIGWGMVKTIDACPMGRPSKVPAINGMRDDIYGNFQNNLRVGARNGTIISVGGKLTSSGSMGEPDHMASFMIKVKSTSSYKRISLELPRVENVAFPSFFIEGRFDIITLDEAYRMGIRPMRNASFESYFDRNYFNDLFVIEEIHPEIESATTSRRVTTLGESGEKITIKRSRKRRLIGSSSQM